MEINFTTYKRILAYHKIENEEIFKNHLRLLLSRKDIFRSQNKYYKEHCLLTFDDGDISFYHKAYPLLKNHAAVIFIITSLINTETPFWWEEITYYLGNHAGDKKVWELKKWPNYQRVEYLQNLREKSDKPQLKVKQLTSAELLEMQEAGIIIANHSYTHPMFDQCTEEELRWEMRQSRKFFEENKLNGYHIFAYPNGKYNKLSERILREEGIEYAFLFDHKINRGKFNPMRISRLSLNDSTPLWKLRFILSGWHSRLLPVIKKLHAIVSYV